MPESRRHGNIGAGWFETEGPGALAAVGTVHEIKICADVGLSRFHLVRFAASPSLPRLPSSVDIV